MPTEQFIEMYGLNGIRPKDDRKGDKRDDKKDDRKSDKRDDKKDDKTDDKKDDKKQEGDRYKTYKKMLDSLAKSSKAKVLDAKDKELKEIPVKELRATLQDKKLKDVHTVVFNGIITQQLVDVAHEKGVKTLVADKSGNLTKKPVDIEILTKSDF